MNNKFKWFLLALLLSAGTAWADDPVEQKFTHRSTVELAATSTSGRVSLGAYAGTTAWVCNTDTSTGYVKFGDVTVVATVTGFPIEAGQCHTLSTSNASYMAGITASGTAALTAYIGTGSPSSSTASSSGGGGGGGDASAANQVTGNASLDSIDDKTPALVSGASQTYAYLSSPEQVAVGFSAKITPFGEVAVSAPTVPLFYDQYDAALDTTARWAAAGTTVPATSSGSVVLSLAGSNSVSSTLISIPTFSPALAPYVLATQMAVGSAQVDPLNHRFFGAGAVTSYAYTTPLTNGHGFEVDGDGDLNAVVYIAGTRYVVNSTDVTKITASGSWAANMTMSTYGQTMTWPASGTATVIMRYVNGTVFFYYGAGGGVAFDIPIGVASYVPATTLLPIRAASITATAGTVLATSFSLSGTVLGGPLTNVIADAALPFRTATVGAASTAIAATALPMAVGFHPSSPLIPGTAATNAGKAEDAVAASADTGVATLGVRRDTLTSSTSATGDYSEHAVNQYGAGLGIDWEKHARTYSCAVNVASAASATDIATITGSATTTVYITKVIISGIQTTAGLNDILLVKRSTANTGGTSSGGVEIPHDSADAAATATVLAYTANPTTGTPVGEIRRNYLPIAGVTSVVNPVVVYDFGERGRPIILRGIAQVLAVNLNGATITGGTFDVTYEWFEI